MSFCSASIDVIMLLSCSCYSDGCLVVELFVMFGVSDWYGKICGLSSFAPYCRAYVLGQRWSPIQILVMWSPTLAFLLRVSTSECKAWTGCCCGEWGGVGVLSNVAFFPFLLYSLCFSSCAIGTSSTVKYRCIVQLWFNVLKRCMCYALWLICKPAYCITPDFSLFNCITWFFLMCFEACYGTWDCSLSFVILRKCLCLTDILDFSLSSMKGDHDLFWYFSLNCCFRFC